MSAAGAIRGLIDAPPQEPALMTATADSLLVARREPLGRAVETLIIENDLIQAQFLLDQGCDLYRLIYKPKGTDVLFKVPYPTREPGVGPAPAGDSLEQWLAYYRGGWQVLFPNFGPEVEYRGARLDMHGEAARVPWRLISTAREGNRLDASMALTLRKSPARIERRVTLGVGEPALEIEERVTNLAAMPLDCVWAHHPAFGAPFLSPACRIFTGATRVEADPAYHADANDLAHGKAREWPWAEALDGERLDLSRVPARASGCSRVAVLSGFSEGWYAIQNSELGLGVGLAWDKDIFPYAGLWQEASGEQGYPWFGRGYVTAIEPSSSYFGHGLTRIMETTGTQLTIGPGASVTARMRVLFFEGHRPPGRIGLDGTLER
ncbi:MAG: DUF4432 family protein [Vicinamibacteraceae bacterium]